LNYVFLNENNRQQNPRCSDPGMQILLMLGDQYSGHKESEDTKVKLTLVYNNRNNPHS
jgi:hypothetical protein